MKQFVLFAALGLLLPGCQTDQDAQPAEAQVVTQEFEVETLGVGGDCGRPMLTFRSRLAEAQKIIDAPSYGNAYYAVGLSPDLWSGKILMVSIRKTTSDEQRVVCTHRGPDYAWVTIVSVRLK